ncbi:MAG: wax ester/triacylglycerol synthase family O-acyltransferase [Pseudomonadota bacterium]
MPNKLNTLDYAFLTLEKSTTPINVASLTVLEIPSDYEGNYPKDLLHQLLRQPATGPFRQKLSTPYPSSLHATMPSWVDDDRFDIDYHVRHVALPAPGSMQDLLDLTSRLHGRPLERSRPLWECYLVEGVENNCFAIYLKMHHAAIDGMGGVELMKHWFNPSPTGEIKAPWAWLPAHLSENKNSHNPSDGIFSAATKLFSQMISHTETVQDLSKMLFGQYLKVIGFNHNQSPVPFTAPHSMFNVPINSTRRFVVKSLPLSDIVELCKPANATVNDIVLFLCSSAMRRYMIEKDKLPQRSLNASVPVALDKSSHSGNQITYVIADLATNESDALARIARIAHSTKDAKGELIGISSAAATNFAFLAQGLVAMLNQLHMAKLVPPAANIVISNVPGPKNTLYFGSAKVVATYPLSVLIDGQALNITVISYQNSISFGLLACQDTVSDLDKIADSIETSLEELKASVYLKPELVDT